MPAPTNASVVSERILSRAEIADASVTWTIRFDVPMHPGMAHGAHLFRYYSGLDVAVGRGDDASTLRVTATGTAAELRRLVDWTDELYKGHHLELARDFRGESFMRRPPPERGLG